MFRFLTYLILVLLITPIANAEVSRDDDDTTTGLQREVRRLHPERERLKAMKKLQEQMSRQAEPKADPWDTSDEVWGTVDVPRLAAADSDAVEGRRLQMQQRTSKTAAEQAALDSLLNTQYTPAEYGYHRMTWRDLPVTKSIDELMPGFTKTDDGDCLSKYVSREKISNEVYFVFNVQDSDSMPGPLRLCVQYCADDPLDFDQLLFTIDGYDYPFYPSETQRGTLPGNLYWEFCDDVLNLAYRDLAYALAHSNWVAMKLVSTRGIHHVKMLTEGQRKDFADTLDLYRLLGGGF